MVESFRKGPAEATKPRYSLTIPPERRGKISGVYRIDAKKIAEMNATYTSFMKMPGEKRKDWLIGGTLLKAFDGWKLLPPEITENDSEERREILSFIANEQDGEYGALPSPEAISIELARILLGTFKEWNELEPATQFIAERDIILFINQNHPEFDEIPEKHDDIKDEYAILEAPHHLPTKTNYHQANEQIRQKIIAKIIAKIAELAEEYGNDEYDKNRGPSSEETRLADIAEMTSMSARTAIRPIPPAGESVPPPHGIPLPKRRSIIPAILSLVTGRKKQK